MNRVKYGGLDDLNYSRDVRVLEWVSVEDELPEIGREVIVCCPQSRRKVTALCRLIPYEGAVEFYWDNAYPLSGNCHVQDSVTHWSPLPEAPYEA